MKMDNDMKACTTGQQGVSLIAMSFLLMGLGLFSLPAIQIYKAQNNYAAKAETDEKIAHVQSALAHYMSQNGRYPCPAPLNAALDTDDFGVEVSSDCSVATAFDGTERAAGRGDRMVRTGAVPVRTLGIPDSYSYDGYKQRLVYAVTEEYAVKDKRPERDHGAIQILDGNRNNATSAPGNVVQIVFSTGMDMNGSYDLNGVRIQACDADARSGENCNYAADAIFMNTLQKSSSQNADDAFVHTVSYVPNKDIVPCEDKPSGSIPKDTAFLVDTSGSMYDPAACPPGMGTDCRRIDVAHWAMRRIVPARMYGNKLIEKPGVTSMTGFKCVNKTEDNINDCKQVNQDSFSEIVFNDPAVDAPLEGDALTTKLEEELKGMCPPSKQSGTPLALHMKELAFKLKGSDDENRPNKITVISDGKNNVKPYDPVEIAKEIKRDYPNLQVDIIDVVGNPELEKVSEITGGKYYRSDNPTELLKALYNSAGVCQPHIPTEPDDLNYCDGDEKK